MLAPEKTIFFFQVLFSVSNFSPAPGASASTKSTAQLGSFHLLETCVNREVCFKLCQRRPVGSYHTLDRLAKVSAGAEHGEVTGSGQGMGRTQSGDICSARFGVSPHDQHGRSTFFWGWEPPAGL